MTRKLTYQKHLSRTRKLIVTTHGAGVSSSDMSMNPGVIEKNNPVKISSSYKYGSSTKNCCLTLEIGKPQCISLLRSISDTY